MKKLPKFDHPAIDSISDERSSGDGLWLYLQPGWLTSEGLKSIHEDRVTDCRRELKDVRYAPGEWFDSLAWAYPGQIGLLPGG